jgi:peptidoglycan/xylan/chitin deacetylase (PgdA/CDA1 family)
LAFIGLGQNSVRLAVSADSTSGSNLIMNGSAETGSGNAATGWSTDSWGGTKATFTRPSGGAEDGSFSLLTTITTAGSGDAKWYPDVVTVPASTSCTYSDFYKSSLANEIDIMDSTGNNTLFTKQGLAAETAWTPASFTFTTSASTTQIIIYHLFTPKKGATIQLDNAVLTCGSGTLPPPPPSVTITNPTTGSTVPAAVDEIDATASGATSVDFKVDGTDLGTDTTAPYTASWNATGDAPGSSHTITATATNSTGNMTATSTVTIATPATPTISITAPTPNSTVSGTSVPFTADTGSTTGVSSVAFKVDGNTVGTDTTAPYSINWDTTNVTNATHSLTATVTATGGTVTSTQVSVTVSNQTQGGGGGSFGPNLYLNPGAEKGSGTTPANFTKDFYGSNTRSFSWTTSAPHSGTHALQVSVTKFKSGDAGWDPVADPSGGIAVTPGQTYYFSDWYKSTADSQLEVVINLSNGTTIYDPVYNPVISGNWTFASSGPVVMPAGAVTAYANQLLATTGTITTDDYYMGVYQPTPFSKGIVSFVFDDGLSSHYTNLLPLLKNDGNIPVTFGIITSEMTSGDPDYMTVAQIQALQAEGSEITSHTVTHPDLTTLPTGTSCTTAGTVTYELCHSQQVLQTTFNVQSPDLILPFGAYNTADLTVAKKYYQSMRTVNNGFNDADSFDPYQLRVFNIYDNTGADSTSYTSPVDVEAAIDYAATHKVWLIFVYHGVGQTSQSPYNTTVADMTAELNYAKSANVDLRTETQALAEVQSQLQPSQPPF